MKALFLVFALAGSALAQTAALLPQPVAQFFDNSGRPLVSGMVYSCAAGAACPGPSPLATYQDSAATTPNTNPVVLDAAGRARIWLTNAPYKIVVKSAAGVTITTTDNVQAGGFANTGPWLISGSTIANDPTVGTKVCISTATCTTALALLNIQGTSSGTNYLMRIDDAGNSPGISLYASGSSVGAYTADAAGLRLRSAGGTSQMVVGDGNVTILNAGSGSSTLTVKAGFAQGSARLVNVLSNGGLDLAYIDANGQYLGTLFNANPARGVDIAYQTANSNFSVNGNGDISSNGSVNATGADGLDPYRINGATMVDAGGNATFTSVTCTGSPCGSGGGGGGGGGSPAGVTDSIQVKATGTTFAGDANFTYTPGTGIVQLLGAGYVTSHGGFLADGTATNIIQAPNGGILGQTLRTTDSVIWVQEAAPAASASGQSRMYMDSTSHQVNLSQNAGSYAPLATKSGALVNGNCASFDASGNIVDAGGPCTTGGGGGTVASATINNMAYYTGTGTTVGGASQFTWDNATKQVAITGTSTGVPAITVTTGYVAADGGFATTSVATNAIQAPSGGVASKWLYTSDSLILAEEAAPALSGAGQARLYADSSSHTLKLSQNGSTYAVIGSGGGGAGVTSITGTASQVIANVSTGAVILSTPQNIATSSTPQFAGVISTGAFNSQASGSSIAFQTASSSYSVDGNGNLSAIGQINLAGGSSAYKMQGVTVIDQSRNAAVNNLVVSGTCTGCGGGGGGGVTSLTGTFGQVNVSSSTGAVTLSLPQSIATNSTPTFSGVVAGAFNSTASGSTIAFQTSNSRIQMDGNGNISAFGEMNLTGSSTYKMNGSVVINSSRAFVGAGVDVGSNGISAGNYNVAGGYLGQTFNVNIPGMSISGTGCGSGLIFRAGILVSCY